MQETCATGRLAPAAPLGSLQRKSPRGPVPTGGPAPARGLLRTAVVAATDALRQPQGEGSCLRITYTCLLEEAHLREAWECCSSAQAHPRCVFNSHKEALGGDVQEGGPWGVAALPEAALAGGGHRAQEAAPGGRAAEGARARGAAAGAQR